MEKGRKFLVTRSKKDGHAVRIWANDTSLINHVDDEFKQIWNEIKVPDPRSVKEALEKADITPTDKNNVAKYQGCPV